MAELINQDLLVKILRYLYASQETNKNFRTSINVRGSTLSVAIKLLCKMGFVTNTGKVTKNGNNFLIENGLDNIFRGEFSPFGVDFNHKNKGRLAPFLDILSNRPKPDYKLDHQPLLPELTMMRANYIASEENLYNKRVAFVGDYDSTNVALNLSTKVGHSTVFDIDKRIIKFFNKIAKVSNYKIETVECDIFKFKNNVYKNSYDVFITDPPYALKGMISFIDFSISLLKEGGVGYIAVPYHGSISWTERLLFDVDKLLVKRGCVITDIHKGFHSYQTADGLKSSIIRIVKGANNKTIDGSKYYSYKKININKPIVKL